MTPLFLARKKGERVGWASWFFLRGGVWIVYLGGADVVTTGVLKDWMWIFLIRSALGDERWQREGENENVVVMGRYGMTSVWML